MFGSLPLWSHVHEKSFDKKRCFCALLHKYRSSELLTKLIKENTFLGWL